MGLFVRGSFLALVTLGAAACGISVDLDPQPPMAVAALDAGRRHPDASRIDASRPDEDEAGSGMVDGARPMREAGPALDAGGADDAGVSRLDAGASFRDAGLMTLDAGPPTCMVPCTVLDPTCPCPGASVCRVERSTGTTMCSVGGSVATGSMCSTDSSCVAGDLCVFPPGSAGVIGVCEPYCRMDTDCAPRAVCNIEAFPATAGGIGGCTVPCDPVSGGGGGTCSGSSTCGLTAITTSTGPITTATCIIPGGIGPSGACVMFGSSTECIAGYVCATAAVGNACRPICRSALDCTASGGACVMAIPVGPDLLGYCSG